MRRLLLRSTLQRRPGADSNRKQTTSPISLPRLSRHGSLSSAGLILFSSSKSIPTPNLLNLSNQQYNYFAHEYFSSQSNAGKENQLNDHLQVEIISKENIKPASPTPDHLRTYEVSILDQLFPNMYVPFVYFYENNHDQVKDDHDLIISERRQVLKRSLSTILTKFYPLAGKVKDSRHIDCNDEGVYYVEAKVNTDLSDFINNNHYSLNMNRLLPFDYNSNDLFSQTYLVMIQVTVFGCGGIAIGLYTSHKIMDGSSHATFLKAWAAATHGESSNLSIVKSINPSFISPSIFPSNPALPQAATLLLLSSSSSLKVRSKSVIRRFVFSASSLKTLKKKMESSSRAMAVTGLIWKCIMSSNKARSSTRLCSSLSIAVNLRNKISPPISPYAIGNIIWFATPNFYKKRQQLIKVDDYDSIATILKNAVMEINSDFVEKMKGKVLDQLNEMTKECYSNENVDFMTVSSMCNCEIYEATDFGWGKPIWARIGYGCVDFHLHNFLLLMDTRFGNGVEAWLTLSEEDMDVVEKDPELLTFASLNPCPLL